MPYCRTSVDMYFGNYIKANLDAWKMNTPKYRKLVAYHSIYFQNCHREFDQFYLDPCQNDGSGWAALSNSSIFLGVNSDTLIISGATTFMDNNQYRCIVTSCKSDTSQAGTLTVIDNFGLFEDFQSTRMTIGPNPNDGHFTLEVDESIVGSDYEMTDELGHLIEKGKLQSTAQQFGLFGQPKGVYHISIISTNGIKTVSVVVQ